MPKQGDFTLTRQRAQEILESRGFSSASIGMILNNAREGRQQITGRGVVTYDEKSGKYRIQ